MNSSAPVKSPKSRAGFEENAAGFVIVNDLASADMWLPTHLHQLLTKSRRALES
jgi:hypothetical protein